jgi:uncharacterized protein (TIGR03067 family)
MRHFITFAVIVAVPNLVRADALQDEMKKLQGLWKFVDAESDGRRLGKDTLPAERITIQDDMIQVGDNAARRFVVDPAKRPKQMDTKGSDGKVEAKLIYELDGDNLKLAFEFELFNRGNLERPKSFETKGTKTLLLILKREKK